MSFRFWQLICISPIGFDGQMRATQLYAYRTYCFTIIGLHIIVIIVSLIFGDQLLHPESSPSIRLIDRSTLFLIQLCCLVIFVESYNKRFIHVDILRKINSIDFILEYQIGINLNYQKQKNINKYRLLRLLIYNIIVGIVILVTSYILFPIVYRWWIVFYPSLFIYSMRCYQITTYVDIIAHRYRLINEFFIEIPKQKNENHIFNVELAKSVENLFIIFQKHKTKSIYEQINDLRKVCRSLNSVNQNINEIFKWSAPLIVLSDFINLLNNLCWNLALFYRGDTPVYYLIPPSLWIALNCSHVIMISAVCHRASKEVLYL